MNQLMIAILTQRELFLLILCTVTYVALFVVAVQNSRRKIIMLEDRLAKVRVMQEQQQAQSQQSIEANQQKIEELEQLLEQLDDENSLLKLELEEKKAKLDYHNKVAMIESEKRKNAETTIFGSDINLALGAFNHSGVCRKAVGKRHIDDTIVVGGGVLDANNIGSIVVETVESEDNAIGSLARINGDGGDTTTKEIIAVADKDGIGFSDTGADQIVESIADCRNGLIVVNGTEATDAGNE